jgi:hypothetical protein
MLSDTSYTPLPLAVATGTDIDVEFDDDSKDLFFSYDQLPGSVVAVEVKDGKHGTTHIWSLNKLKQRLMSMRGMYNQQDDDISDQSTDPFYDHTPWFKSIGHSHIFISNLLIPEILVRKVAIVGSRGDVKGHLTISIRYLAEEELDEKSISECVTLNFDKSVPRKSIISVSSDPVYMVVRPSLEEKAKSIFSSTDLLDCSVELAEEVSYYLVATGKAVLLGLKIAFSIYMCLCVSFLYSPEVFLYKTSIQISFIHFSYNASVRKLHFDFLAYGKLNFDHFSYTN